jgi:hypothetical protein
MAKRQNLFIELVGFLAKHKAYWLVPILIIAILFSVLIALASLSPAAAPLIYTLF